MSANNPMDKRFQSPLCFFFPKRRKYSFLLYFCRPKCAGLSVLVTGSHEVRPEGYNIGTK